MKFRLIDAAKKEFAGRTAWSKAYWIWLGQQGFDFAHQQFAFEELKRRVLEAQAPVGAS